MFLCFFAESLLCQLQKENETRLRHMWRGATTRLKAQQNAESGSSDEPFDKSIASLMHLFNMSRDSAKKEYRRFKKVSEPKLDEEEPRQVALLYSKADHLIVQIVPLTLQSTTFMVPAVKSRISMKYIFVIRFRVRWSIDHQRLHLSRMPIWIPMTMPLLCI